jgi:hypothetical protein
MAEGINQAGELRQDSPENPGDGQDCYEQLLDFEDSITGISKYAVRTWCANR